MLNSIIAYMEIYEFSVKRAIRGQDIFIAYYLLIEWWNIYIDQEASYLCG